MRAGLLKECIVFQQLEIVKDEYGATEQIYNDLINTRARVEYSGGSRTNTNNEIYNEYSLTFTVRGYHQIKEDMLIKWRDKLYRILSIDDTIKEMKVIQAELLNI